MTEAEMKPNKWKKVAVSMAGGAIVGFLIAFFTMRFADAGTFGDLEETQVVALLVAMLYVVMALVVGLGTIMPGFGAKFLNVEDAEELEEMRGSLVASGVGMFALGVILVLIALSGSGGLVAPNTAAIVSGLLLVVAVFYSWRSMKQSDELMREIGRDGAAISYYIMALVLGVWAAGAHLGMLEAPSPMVILITIWSVVLLAVFIAAGRKGMLEPR